MQIVLQQLLGGRRLCLVLDLDHTLVNSAKFSEVDGDWEFKLEQLAADQVTMEQCACLMMAAPTSLCQLLQPPPWWRAYTGSNGIAYR